LDEVGDWSRDEKGNVRHKSGQFFGIEGVRTESGALREVASWDQPIYTQPEGGILDLIAREHAAKGVEFLLYAKAEPGNIGVLQLCLSIQSTWSNIRRAHGGKLSPMRRFLLPRPASASSTVPNITKRAAGFGESRTRMSSHLSKIRA
jgi:oxidase EvaA